MVNSYSETVEPVNASNRLILSAGRTKSGVDRDYFCWDVHERLGAAIVAIPDCTSASGCRADSTPLWRVFRCYPCGRVLALFQVRY